MPPHSTMSLTAVVLLSKRFGPAFTVASAPPVIAMPASFSVVEVAVEEALSTAASLSPSHHCFDCINLLLLPVIKPTRLLILILLRTMDHL